MSKPKIYGIKNCNTMKKTFDWMDGQGVAYEFHDYKKEGTDEAVLKSAMKSHGWENVINRKGMTWRKLDESVQANMNEQSAIEIAREKPSIIKRPLLVVQDNVYLGFDEKTYKEIF